MTPQSPRIAFLVEGDEDKVVVEELLRRIATEENLRQPQFKTVRLNGSPSVRYFIPELRQLHKQGYRHVVLVFDAHQEDERALLEQLQGKLHRAGMTNQDRVDLIAVTPSIEAWLLADDKALSEVTDQKPQEGVPPKEAIRQMIGGRLQLIKDLASRVRISVLRQKDRAFQQFENSVRDALLPGAA